MTPFEMLKEKLAARGFRLLTQWEVKREQGKLVCYQIRGEDRAPQVAQVLIFHWPDGGYDSFLPPIVNSVEADVALICG